ncbi:MAG: hypothetical protein RR162_04630, partial [Oscillospiraceae bacterium]
YKNAHSLNLNELQGYGRGKPLLAVCFGTASLGIMGVPFFNGYVSKTLLHEAIVEKIMMFETSTLSSSMLQLTEGIFLLSGGFTVAYMTKLFICLFVKKPVKEFPLSDKPYVTIKTGAVIGCVSALIFAFGAFPHQTLDKIAGTTAAFMGVHPLENEINYFSLANLKGAAISIGIGVLLYFVVARLTVVTKENGYVNPWNKKYSVENLVWKPLLFEFFPFVFGFIGRVIDKSTELVLYVIRRFLMSTAKIPATFFSGKKQAEDENISPPAVSITRSLSYSLLLFGVGFVITMLYLLLSQL